MTYFDTYQKMNSLMQTLQATSSVKKTNKPSLKISQLGLKVSALTGTNPIDTLYTGGDASPLGRELMRDLGSREDGSGDKQVAFSIENSPIQTQMASPSSIGQKNALQSIAKKQRVAPKNFKLLAKQSFEMQVSREQGMVDTLETFFDTNKLYLKSVQQE